MIIDSKNAIHAPKPEQIKNIFEMSRKIAEKSKDENQWYENINHLALNWLKTKEINEL
ncbi:hypothetical protein [Helicobacter cappadocius]|uniref:Uncharacterized protein n=1 Tax=Helicobacter cappadocius TaxID=3063998 RepID=A0AA90PT49_9HELI|nr:MULTISPECIES: hypothetical protein [unclassified Helicobacter]MDO7252373.1 hypothetical protein [Helicobacter sp. faydin-H75]MDP2538240.1 hypothetical protein [Helicobacter sp. faydin-H76]